MFDDSYSQTMLGPKTSTFLLSTIPYKFFSSLFEDIYSQTMLKPKTSVPRA